MHPMTRPAAVSRAFARLTPLALLLVLSTCARDVTGGLQTEPFPIEIRINMSLEDDATLEGIDSWYYIVFNFSKVPNPPEEDYPIDIIANEDRGRNWELYVCFHRDQINGLDEIFTAQRSRVPTILPTGALPQDAAVGQFNADEVADILVAAGDSGEIQFIEGVQQRVFDNVSFLQAVNVSSGPTPLRVFSAGPVEGGALPTTPLDFNADGNQDALAIFAGAAPGAGFIRPLISNDDGTFTAGTETPIPGIPVDAILVDFDAPETGAGNFDLAVLTVDSPGGAGTVRLLMGNGDGTFTPGATSAAGDDPVQLAAGALRTAPGPDIAVASRGDSTVRVIYGDGAGALSAGPVLTLPGPAAGVSVNNMLDTEDDVVFTYNGAGETDGHVGVFLRIGDSFAEVPITLPLTRPAGPVVTFDGDGDSRPDAYIVDRSTVGAGGNVIIARNGARRLPDSTTLEFFWAEAGIDDQPDEQPILYPAGATPSRIAMGDINSDGVVDLLVPNSGAGVNGNSLGVYYGLGRHNYTNDNIFWTDGITSDSQAQDLTIQSWYLSHSFTGREISLTIDASQFLDLTQLPPELLLAHKTDRSYFMVDLMTATHPIDLMHDKDETEGTVTEHFTVPVSVPMQLGFLDNESSVPRVQGNVSPRSQNITNWAVEVN